MCRIPILLACAACVVLLFADDARADSVLFTRAMETPRPRRHASLVSARFSDVGRGGFSLGLSGLSVEATGLTGGGATLTGLSGGPSSSGSVGAISATLSAGSRLGGGGGGGGGGGAAAGGRDGVGRGSAASTRFAFASPAQSWREFVTGQLNNPTDGPQTRLPSFVGYDGGPFASLPPGLLDSGRPGHRVPDRIRDRLETLLGGLRRPTVPEEPGEGETPLPLPGSPGGVDTTPPNPGEVIPQPEPSSLALLGIGLASVAGVSWRRRRRELAGKSCHSGT